MKNKKIILIMAFFLAIISIFWFIIYTKFFNIEKTEIFQVYNESISEVLEKYNNYTDFESIKYIEKEVNNREIVDFDIDFDKNSSQTWSLVEFSFANNKMTFLIDSIFTNKDNSIYKVFYSSYLKSYFNSKDLKISSFIDEKIDYLEIFEDFIDLNYFADENEKITKFFIISKLVNNNSFSDLDFYQDLASNLLENFDSLNIDEKLLFLTYLDENWDLFNFLSDLDLWLDKLFNINNLSNTQELNYLYLLSKNNIEIELDLEKFTNLNDRSKIFLVWILNNLWKDFSEKYSILEEKWNINLDIHDKFLKFLVFKNLKNEYTSYEKYSKFWYSSWVLLNRRMEYELNLDSPFFKQEHKFENLIYNNRIDTRIASFMWEKFYLQITVKEK